MTSSTGLLVMLDQLQEHGFSREALLLENVGKVYDELRRLEASVAKGEGYGRACACACREGAHSPDCDLGFLLRLTGGEEEGKRQYDGAHRQALGINSVWYNRNRPRRNERQSLPPVQIK